MAQYEHTPGDSAHQKSSPALQSSCASSKYGLQSSLQFVAQPECRVQSTDLCVLFASQAHVD